MRKKTTKRRQQSKKEEVPKNLEFVSVQKEETEEIKGEAKRVP